MSDGATIEIKGKIDHLQSQLREAKKSVKEFGESVDKSLRTLANLGQTTAGAFGMEFAYEKLKGFVEAASEAETASIRFETVFKNMGDEALMSGERLSKLTEEVKKNTSASEHQIHEVEMAFMSLGDIRGSILEDATKQTKALSILMGRDMVSSAHLLAMALERPEMAFRLLTRNGVAFSKEQARLATMYDRSGQKSAAQEIILGAISHSTKGLTERYKGSYAGQMEDFKNTLHEGAVSVGKAIIDVIVQNKDTFQGVAQLLVEAAKGLAQVLGGIGEILKRLGMDKLFHTDMEKDKLNTSILMRNAGGQGWENEINRWTANHGWAATKMNFGLATQGYGPADWAAPGTADERRFKINAMKTTIGAENFTTDEQIAKAAKSDAGPGKKDVYNVPTAFKSQIEDLDAMNKRILQAAYSDQGTDPNDGARADVAEIAAILRTHFPDMAQNTREVAQNVQPAGALA